MYDDDDDDIIILEKKVMKPKSRCQLVTQSPSAKNQTTWVPKAIAWVIAQSVAAKTHFGVILYGEFGTARFSLDGSGVVEWNENSDCPGEFTRFDDNCTVCIN